MRALLIAGTHSGVGKTTVAAAAIAGLRARGLRLAAFKTGPDFLDPFHLAAAAGSACRTLDSWMLGRDGCAAALARAAAETDIAVIEGMMGLFDGRTGASDEGSSAELARRFDLPAVLVADASAGARSLAATVLGFARFDPRVRLAGVVFNRVAGAGHLAMLRDAMRGLPGIAVLGGCPADEALRIPERHLGLALPSAPGPSAAWAERHLNLDRLLTLAVELELPAAPLPAAPPAPRLRMAVARDEAFCFYYPENLELLRAAGFELVEFSPLRDAALPGSVHAVYLGGGYPELHRDALAANRAMRESVRAFAAAGGFVYAECGGLMYLAESLDGAPMAGVVPAAVEMQPRLQAIGYREVEVAALGGLRARGHEFHHSRILRRADTPPAHYVLTPQGKIPEGFATSNVVASYIHLHFAGCPELPRRMALAAARARPALPLTARKTETRSDISARS